MDVGMVETSMAARTAGNYAAIARAPAEILHVNSVLREYDR